MEVHGVINRNINCCFYVTVSSEGGCGCEWGQWFSQRCRITTWIYPWGLFINMWYMSWVIYYLKLHRVHNLVHNIQSWFTTFYEIYFQTFYQRCNGFHIFCRLGCYEIYCQKQVIHRSIRKKGMKIPYVHLYMYEFIRSWMWSRWRRLQIALLTQWRWKQLVTVKHWVSDSNRRVRMCVRKYQSCLTLNYKPCRIKVSFSAQLHLQILRKTFCIVILQSVIVAVVDKWQWYGNESYVLIEHVVQREGNSHINHNFFIIIASHLIDCRLHGHTRTSCWC